jgi:homodimeric cytidine deaminase
MTNEWIEQVASLSQKPDGRYLTAQESRDLSAGGRLLDLLPCAKQIAQPGISGFRVGAVAVAASDAIYFGANFEFPGAGLLYTVHAEQAVALNARIHGETRIKQIAVSAPPCGRCRQFLNEIEGGEDIEIITKTAKPARLAEWLPHSFGPADLKVTGGMLTPRENPIATLGGAFDDLAQQAWEAARHCYAPYTNVYAAIALRFRGGAIHRECRLQSIAAAPAVGFGERGAPRPASRRDRNSGAGSNGERNSQSRADHARTAGRGSIESATESGPPTGRAAESYSPRRRALT